MRNMDTFKQEIQKAIENHYSKVLKSFSDLYGYTLYTDDSLCSIGPVYNRESDIAVSESDEMYDYYKYGAMEWANFEDFGIFSGANGLLVKIMGCDHPDWMEKRRELLVACLAALSDLDECNLFGPKDSGRFIAICIADSDDPIMELSARLLNNSNVYKAYTKAFS